MKKHEQRRVQNQARREREDGDAKAFRARRAAKATSYRTSRAALRAGVEV